MFKDDVEKLDRACDSAVLVISLGRCKLLPGHDHRDTMIPAARKELANGRIRFLTAFGQVEGHLPDIF
jgi:hypothetical protein